MKIHQPTIQQKRFGKFNNSSLSSQSLKKGGKNTTRFLIPSSNNHPSATNRLLTPIARGPNSKLSSNCGILSQTQPLNFVRYNDSSQTSKGKRLNRSYENQLENLYQQQQLQQQQLQQQQQEMNPINYLLESDE